MTPSPRSRRKAEEVAAKRQLYADLDSMIEAKDEALKRTLYFLKTCEPQRTAVSLNKLRGLLRQADVEAEVLAELVEKKRRQA